MELHERFEYPEIREVIFGYSPEYSDKYDLAIYLRRIVLLSAALVRVYYKNKKSGKVNMTSRTIDRIINRPYISVDNSISILLALQRADEEVEELGLSDLKILSDENNDDYIDLYELKTILQDETGKFFDAVHCKEIINKVIVCVNFITIANIKNEADRIWFEFKGETFDVSDLLKYEYCYLYRSLQEVDPLKTDYIPL